MRDTSLSHRKYKKRIFYTTPEIRRVVYILAALFNKQSAIYTNEACKRWLPQAELISFHVKNRTEPINIYIDRELEIAFSQKLGSTSNQRSSLIYQCIEREVSTQIAKWRCETPQEFINLMTSDEPLQLLEFSNKKSFSREQVAA
jgi:hypothetical protein